jgi:hypothetical protein
MPPVPEAFLWAEQVAARLWMLQTSFADDPPNTRYDYLVEQIEPSIKDAARSKRSESVAALTERFPASERIDALFFKTPEVETVTRGLQKIATGWPLERLGKLGISPKETLDEERLIKLFTTLLEMVATLDHLIWNVWRNVAPKSNVRSAQSGNNPRRTIERYLSGDREVVTLQITRIREKTRKLTARLLSAIGLAGEIFARIHLEKLAPEKIRTGVELNSTGFMSNVEQKWWRRYVELVAELSGQAVETKIVDEIVAYTEELISRSEILLFSSAARRECPQRATNPKRKFAFVRWTGNEPNRLRYMTLPKSAT